MKRIALILWLLAAVAEAAVDSGIHFRDVSPTWGVDFRHHDGGSGKRYMVETMAAGVLIFDFDADGDEDIFYLDGGELPGYEGETPRSRLFRNEGGRGFVEFTTRAGLEVGGYATGGTAGDLDNDGDLDLFVSCYGPNELWRNNGDGTFTSATDKLPPSKPVWSASAAFSDVDLDGDLDLYVANYVDARIDNHKVCRDRGIPIYCPPGTYPGVADVFYRNRGGGILEDATAAAGLVPVEHMAGLGVAFGDLDNDAWPDLYVANDTEPNFLFHNLGGGVFEEKSFLWGTAVSERGKVEAGMGVDLGDVDGDGNLDIVVTNFEMETNALYKNTGLGLFIDSRYPTNVAESSLIALAFGVAFADLDHDSDLDLIIANGHVRDNAELFHEESRFAQRNQVLENTGGGRFEEVHETGLDIVRVSRGLAVADFDLDGDLDVAINNIDDLAEIYENVSGAASGNWLMIDLEGQRSNRRGIGARLLLVDASRRLLREVRTASSFLSQSAITAHYGLGSAARVPALEVRWPAGGRTRFQDLPVNRRLRLHE